MRNLQEAFKKELKRMEFEEFKKAIRYKDFAIGDSFWLEDIEFKVVGMRRFPKELE